MHTHVQFPAYDADREEVIRRAKAAGVKMIAVGTQAASSEAAIVLSRAFPGEVWATVGFHPNHTSSAWYHDSKEQGGGVRETFDGALMERLARESEVVAIGECGLDYFRLPLDGDEAIKEKEEQRKVFREHISLAQKLGKPLMLHCRPSGKTDDAYEDLLQLIIDNQKITIPKILHFYVGSLEMTKKFLEAGFYFTLGGVITFTHDYDEMVKLLPIDRILLETDAPYVAPAPHRGKRNEPSFILETARKVAELKGLEYDTVLRSTAKNTRTLFGI
ncbi:MAG: TatD family hydrolase [Patescibacteria group bacterium]